MKKKIISSIVAGLLICLAPTTVYAGTWIQTSKSGLYWSYLKDDGSRANNEWIYDNGSWYYFEGCSMLFDSNHTTGGYDYYLSSSGKMVSGGFADRGSHVDKVFADKDGHLVNGLFMVDGVLYSAYNTLIPANGVYPARLYVLVNGKTIIRIDCFFDHGKVLDKDGKPFAANSELYTNIKYLPKYDSKGNLIGEIKNENGYTFNLGGVTKGTGPR